MYQHNTLHLVAIATMVVALFFWLIRIIILVGRGEFDTLRHTFLIPLGIPFLLTGELLRNGPYDLISVLFVLLGFVLGIVGCLKLNHWRKAQKPAAHSELG